MAIAFLMGFTKEKIDKKTILETPLTQTDGEWIWSSLLTYYVDKYNIPLPGEFIAHMKQNSWTVDKEKVKSIIGLSDIRDKKRF